MQEEDIGLESQNLDCDETLSDSDIIFECTTEEWISEDDDKGKEKEKAKKKKTKSPPVKRQKTGKIFFCL